MTKNHIEEKLLPSNQILAFLNLVNCTFTEFFSTSNFKVQENPTKNGRKTAVKRSKNGRKTVEKWSKNVATFFMAISHFVTDFKNAFLVRFSYH